MPVLSSQSLEAARQDTLCRSLLSRRFGICCHMVGKKSNETRNPKRGRLTMQEMNSNAGDPQIHPGPIGTFDRTGAVRRKLSRIERELTHVQSRIRRIAAGSGPHPKEVMMLLQVHKPFEGMFARSLCRFRPHVCRFFSSY